MSRSKSSRRAASPWSRRRFLAAGGALAAGAAATIVPRHVLGGAGFVPPSETLNLAVIGTGGRGKQVTSEMMRHPDVRVVAIADPNDRADYERFYYKKTSGRLVVREMIEERYAAKKASGEYPGCRDYVDFRVLLEKEKGIDAVVVATPDHVHAAATLAALRLKKHVYCEKPLTHTVEEARRVAEEARRAGVATQMGNQGNSGEGIRQACEWIWAGAIGDVTEVHSWSQTGGWANQYADRPKDEPAVPPGFDWDLWLGPVPKRPYHPAYAPYNWRGWWAFGTGAIGDMGCHNIDPARAALKLGPPSTIEASSTPVNGETVPDASLIHYTFPARENMPPVKLTWYDCGLYPPRPDEFEPGEKFDSNGILFVGTKGKLLMGGWSRDPRLLPKSRMKEFAAPAKTLRRVEAHDRAWLDACKGGPPASSNFDYSGPLTELILLGQVAVRTGEKLQWDNANIKATNCAAADKFLRAEYRPGWGIA
ncbi:MAG TPA: Gfo/Idh/MocA family oxidoreductase [Planctomycetota bacterium]|jgi:predicted dehydrogenase|nr:Gfo/Idh/MocA family oxidoreductase [Planctomycetota bacterium]